MKKKNCNKMFIAFSAWTKRQHRTEHDYWSWRESQGVNCTVWSTDKRTYRGVAQHRGQGQPNWRVGEGGGHTVRPKSRQTLRQDGKPTVVQCQWEIEPIDIDIRYNNCLFNVFFLCWSINCKCF